MIMNLGFIGYPLYEVDGIGKVYSIRNKIIELKPSKNPKGYLKVILYNENGRKTFSVHQLVGKAFIPNPNNYTEINHKNGNKTDNRIENLEWCNRNYNINYGDRNKKVSNKVKFGRHPSSKKVLKIDKDTNEVICEYESVSEASAILNICKTNISACCLHKPYHDTAGGFKWEYKKESD